MKDFQNLVFLDTETTGIDSEDRVAQVAFRWKGENKESLFKPPLPIKVEAMAVSHITNKMVEKKEAFSDSKMKKELDVLFSSGNILVAHNASFDIGMLKKEGLEIEKYIDTFKIAQVLDTEAKIPKYNLQYLRYYLGLEIEAQAHDALGDVLVLEALFERLYKKMKSSEKNYEEITSEMMEISQKPILIKRFAFGKHLGEKIEEVAKKDRGYLEWLLGEKKKEERAGNPDPDWLYTLEKYV